MSYVHVLIHTFVCTDSTPITNGTATVTLNGLECGVTYTIIAGGTLNGDLVGPRSSHGTVTADNLPCPVMTPTTTVTTGKGT